MGSSGSSGCCRPRRAKSSQAHFLNFCRCVLCLAAVFVPRGAAEPGGGRGCRPARAAADVAQRGAGRTPAALGQRCGLPCALWPRSCPFCVPFPARNLPPDLISCPQKQLPRVVLLHLSPFAARTGGVGRERLAARWSCFAPGDSGTAQGRGRKRPSPFLVSRVPGRGCARSFPPSQLCRAAESVFHLSFARIAVLRGWQM